MTRNVIVAAILLLGAILPFPGKPVSAVDYIEYRDWLRPKDVIRFYSPEEDSSESHGSYGGDAVILVSYCPKESKFYCVKSGKLTFAVPKSYSRTVREWVFEGHEYRVEDVDIDLKLLGRSVEGLSLISVSATALPHADGAQGDQETLFTLYSRCSGIVAFALESNLTGRTKYLFWLTGMTGLGAMENCTE